MPTSNLIEKKRSSVKDPADRTLDKPENTPRDKFVFLLVPQADGLRLMRANVDRLMEIAQPVALVPHELSDRAIPYLSQIELPPLPAPVLMDGNADGQPLQSPSAGRSGGVRFGHVHIDLASRVVTVAGAVVQLAPLEFDLLVALYRRAGGAMSRVELMREVWRGRRGVTSRTVDTHIFNLRRKLEPDPSRPQYLLTVSKIGYRLGGI